MLKQLQQRFILFAMAAFAAVMVLLVVCINGVNYIQTRSTQDETLAGLSAYKYDVVTNPGEPVRPITDMPWAGGSSEFTQRYFLVLFDSVGHVLVCDRDHISSVDETLAVQYAAYVLNLGEKSGTLGEYRYLVEEQDVYTTVVFLNVSTSTAAQKRLLMTSGGIALTALLIVFFIVLLMSRRVVEPYVRNNELQKRFITDASHELKTPITSIATSADILAMDEGDNEWVTNIQNQTTRLGKLVNELVMLSRLDEDKPSLNMSDFSVSEAAWEIAESFTARAKGKGITFDIAIAEGVTMHGDRAMIQRTISILLENAFTYCAPEGEVRLSVERDKTREKGKTVIEAFNTCDAVPEGDLNLLFNRFYRLDESRNKNTGGTGIGLSIARAVVEKHGGKITASSADGKSMLFRIVM